jgi:hypothetical protein
MATLENGTRLFEIQLMKPTSEKEVREETTKGKNEPLASSPKVIPGQNAEVRPIREAAQAQPGTDEVDHSEHGVGPSQ